MGCKSINVLVVGLGDIGYSFCKTISEYNYNFSKKCDDKIKTLNEGEKREKLNIIEQFRKDFLPIKAFAIDNIPPKDYEKADSFDKPWFTSLEGDYPYCLMNLYSENADEIFHKSVFSGFDTNKNNRTICARIDDVIPKDDFCNSEVSKDSIDYVVSCFDIVIITVGQDVNSLNVMSKLFRWGSSKHQKVYVRVQDEERKLGVENYYAGFKASQIEKGEELTQNSPDKKRFESWKSDCREIITFNPEQDIAYSESIHFTNPAIRDFLRIADYDRLENDHLWNKSLNSYSGKYEKKISSINYEIRRKFCSQNDKFHLKQTDIDTLKKASLQLTDDNHKRAHNSLLLRHMGVAKISISKTELTKKKVALIKKLINNSLVKSRENRSGNLTQIEKFAYGQKKKHFNVIGYSSQEKEVRHLYEDSNVSYINVATNGKDFLNELESYIKGNGKSGNDNLQNFITLYVRGRLRRIIKISKKLDSSYRSDLFIVNLSKFGKSLSLYSNYLNKGEHVTVISKDSAQVKDVCDAGVNIAFIKDATRFADLKELDLKRLSDSRAMLCYGQNSDDAITAALNLYALGIKDITIRGDIKNNLIDRIVEGLQSKTDKDSKSVKVLSLAKRESSKLLPHIISNRLLEYMPFDDDNKIQISEHGIAKICSYQAIFDKLINSRFKSVVHKLFSDTNTNLSAHWCYGSLFQLLEFTKAIEEEERRLISQPDMSLALKEESKKDFKKKENKRQDISIELLSQDRINKKQCKFERNNNGATLIFVYSNKIDSVNKKENDILDQFVRRFQNIPEDWGISNKMKQSFMINSVYGFGKKLPKSEKKKKLSKCFVDCSDGYYEELFSKSSNDKITSKHFKDLLRNKDAYIYLHGINYYDGRFNQEMEKLLDLKGTKCTFIIYSTNDIVLNNKNVLEAYSFLKPFNKVELTNLKSTVKGVERQVIVKKALSNKEEIYIADFNTAKPTLKEKPKKMNKQKNESL